MFKSKQGQCALVAIEGPDMVGKATQAALLEENLIAKGIRAMAVEVPWKDEVTYDLIYKMLRNGTAATEPVVFQTLQACNRRIMQQTYLPTLSAHFDIVVLDRWTPSTWIYGGAAGISLEQNAVILDGLVKPDLTIILDGEPFQPERAADVYEKDSIFQRAVRAAYWNWSERFDNAFLFDAHQDKKVLAAQILTETRRFYSALE